LGSPGMGGSGKFESVTFDDDGSVAVFQKH